MKGWLARPLAVALLYLAALAGAAAVAQQPSRPAASGPPLMSAGEAHAKALAGEVVLVDIRRPEEWRETGLPASAHAITMHQEPRAFVQQLLAAMGGDRHRPLALICRTGNRSSNLMPQLVKAGFTNVVDVGEGVAGSRHGKGWLEAGLPSRPGSQASVPPKLSTKAPAQ